MSTLKHLPRNGAGERFVPIYICIQEYLRAAIVEGRMNPGDRIWSEAELTRKYDTTRSTVRHALDQLVFEGLIVRHVGRGSFVAHRNEVHSPIDTRYPLSFEQQVAQTGRVVSYRSATLQLATAPPRYAEKLGVAAETVVFKLERLRIIDDRPICLEIRYMPRNIGERVTGDMLANRSAHAFVGEIIGEQIPTIKVSVTAEIATPDVAELLDLAVGAPLLVRDNALHASDGTIVVCGRSLFSGDISTDYVLGQQPPN